MTGPLSGIRVAEIGDLGEVAGKLLADAGADVVRVEPLTGARSRHVGPFVNTEAETKESLRYAYLNTNKRGAAIDPGSSEGRDLWKQLVRTVDVVIDGAGIDALANAGAGHLDFPECDHLIWCSITPFGLTGPRKGWHTNDLVSMAQGGIVMMCGYDDHSLPPVRPDGEHSLSMAGEYAVIGILAALWQREFDGHGQLLDVSIHDAVSGTTEGAFMNWEYLDRNPSRKTGRHAGTVEEWQLQSSDGQYMVLFGAGVPRDRPSFEGLLAWMDEREATGDLRDPKYEALLYTPPGEAGELRKTFADAVARFIATRPAEEIYRRGQAIGMPWAPVRSPEDNLGDEHWADREFWAEGEVAGWSGTVRYPNSPYNFLGSPVSYRRRAPDLGADTWDVLTGELGMDAGSIEALQQAGVILCGEGATGAERAR